MNTRAFRTLSAAALVPLLLAGTSVGFAQSPKKNTPTSKLYVADLTGESHVDYGDKIETLAKNGVFAPEGSVIETKTNSTDSLVLSNGTALYVAADTRFEVKKFKQEPFSPNRTDLDIEPSISQTSIRLTRGSLGICTSKLVAGSSMTYQTAEATVNVRGRRLLIQTDENETRVSLLEGDVTVLGNELSGGETLRPGQQAIARRAADGKVVLTVQPIPDAESAKLDELVSLACISRRTVFFESVERNAATGEREIVPVRTTPATQPTGFTVSPSRL